MWATMYDSMFLSLDCLEKLDLATVATEFGPFPSFLFFK